MAMIVLPKIKAYTASIKLYRPPIADETCPTIPKVDCLLKSFWMKLIGEVGKWNVACVKFELSGMATEDIISETAVESVIY